MRPIQVLYCVFIPPGKARTLLDAIRLIANPATKHPAHITVRGPYDDYQDPRKWSAEVKGQLIQVGGVGDFFQPRQNTVLLKVESPAVKAIWHKPDYPGYNPHVTIYDGDSRPFAEALRNALKMHDPTFAFQATGIEALVSGSGLRALRHFFSPKDIAPILGRQISLDEIDAADDATRLSWIDTLAEQLSQCACAH